MKPKEIFRAMAEKKQVCTINRSRKIIGIIINMSITKSTIRQNNELFVIDNKQIQLDGSTIKIIDYPKCWHIKNTLRNSRDIRVIKEENDLVLIEYTFNNNKKTDTMWLAKCRIRRKK